MKYGVFGLTGDPCTFAHHEIVRKVLNEKLVDKVIVIPTIVDYYREDKKPLFSLCERREIFEKFFNGMDNVYLDFCEYELPEDSRKIRRYIDMLCDIMNRYGKENEYLTIVGGDSWNNLHGWYRYEDLLKMTKFIVINRDNVDLRLYNTNKQDEFYAFTQIEIDDKFNEMSATKIRKHLTEAICGMSLGPSTTTLSLYLEMVDDYLKTGKTPEDRKNEYVEMSSKLNEEIDTYIFEVKESRLKIISEILMDPYKDVLCKYSLIKETIEEKIPWKKF